MPLYEFSCSACGRVFQELRPVNADLTTVKCPYCGADNPRKKLGSFAIGGGSAADSFSAPAPAPGG